LRDGGDGDGIMRRFLRLNVITNPLIHRDSMTQDRSFVSAILPGSKLAESGPASCRSGGGVGPERYIAGRL
jgi:hypothetical protein